MTAPTVNQIIAAIAARLQALPQAGVVHQRLRYATDHKKLLALFGWNGTVRGWTIRRRATIETSQGRGRNHVQHVFEIVLIAGFTDDDSQVEFDRLIEDARDAFRVDDTLGDLVATTGTGDGPGSVIGLQLEEAQPAMFAGILVHLGQMTLATRHHV